MVTTSSAQLPILLDRKSRQTLSAQLISQLRDALRKRRIPPGTRLPSSRALADQLEVSRNTVNRAFDALVVEGYLVSRPASGYFAPHALPEDEARPLRRPVPPRDSQMALMPMPRLPPGSDAAPQTAQNRLSFDFSPGHTDSAQFPVRTWRRMLQTVLSFGSGSGPAASHPVDPGGLAALRQSVADHLSVSRGILADPASVVILSGPQQGIAIMATLLLSPGDLTLMEDPGPIVVGQVFALAGAEVVGVGLDEEGLDPDRLPARAAKLLHVAPTNQYPTGYVLTAERRGKLIEWARRTGCYIIEDDRNAELRYDGGQLAAIAADAGECTIYLGSFWQSLGPGFRLGYMVVPPHLASAVVTAKRLLHGGDSWLEQAALAELMRSGAYSAHLLRQREHYRGNRETLLAAIRHNFGEAATSGGTAGLHLAWHLPPGVPGSAIIEAIGRRARIGVYGLAAAGAQTLRTGAMTERMLILGFGALRPRQIVQGVTRLSDAIDDAVDDPMADVTRLFRAPLPGLAPPPRKRPRRLDRHERTQLALSMPPLRPAGSSARLSTRTGNVPTLSSIYRYPVKGLSGQRLESVNLVAGRPFPLDRIFALARPGAPIDESDPQWAKKGLFCMLMLDEGLARVETSLDLETMDLRATQGGRTVFSANLIEDVGRTQFEAFAWKLLPALPGAPRLVRSRNGHFMDKPDNVLSLINLATLRNLEERWDVQLDHRRFRANFYIDGARPWEEFDWIGEELSIGGLRFRVDRRNGRCGATNVNPVTGRRDLDIPGSLRAAFGHKDLGVYLVALESGPVAVGDAIMAAANPMAAVAAVRPAQASGAPRHICGGCYFVYDPAKGLPQQSIPANTAFVDLPVEWRCPDCGVDKSQFRST